jgi:hypothetical protein
MPGTLVSVLYAVALIASPVVILVGLALDLISKAETCFIARVGDVLGYLSAARDPVKMPTIPWLPSWQAYS